MNQCLFFADMFSEVEHVPFSNSCSNKEAAPLDWARLISYIPRNTHTHAHDSAN